jgi:hypothetical protein
VLLLLVFCHLATLLASNRTTAGNAFTILQGSCFLDGAKPPKAPNTPQHPPCYPIEAIVDLGKNRKPRLVTQVRRTRSHHILYVRLIAVPLVGIIVQLKEGQALPIFGIWDVISPWPRDHQVTESILETHEVNLHCKKFRPLMGTPRCNELRPPLE